MEKLYIFTGEKKDSDGVCRAFITAEAERNGWAVTDDPEKSSLIVALGGDGTIMRAARIACERDIPVIGVNLGRVGYMAELDTSEIPKIADFFDGNYSEESRMTLSVSVGGDEYFALNDAVIHAKNIHMTLLSLYCNGDPVGSYRGDGLVCATPTGSTAYSMSAGGSVIDPRLECICVTPICPQSLTARPFVFAPDSELTVLVESRDCILSLDGGTPILLPEWSEVKIQRSEKPLRMVKLKKDGFYGVLRRKLSE